MAKKNNERQASFREQKRGQGYVELSVWVKESTFKKITTIAVLNGVTKGEVIDDLMPEK